MALITIFNNNGRSAAIEDVLDENLFQSKVENFNQISHVFTILIHLVLDTSFLKFILKSKER
ncbi:MAG: hypothetical protein QXS51_05880 [Thermoproteota archaeon]